MPTAHRPSNQRSRQAWLRFHAAQGKVPWPPAWPLTPRCPASSRPRPSHPHPNLHPSICSRVWVCPQLEPEGLSKRSSGLGERHWPHDQPSEGCTDHNGPRLGPGVHLQAPPAHSPGTPSSRACLTHLGDSGHPRPGKGTQPGLKQKAPVSQGPSARRVLSWQAGDTQGLCQLGPHRPALSFEKDQNGAKQIFIKMKPLL